MNFVEELREMDRVMRAFNGCCEPLAPTVLYRNRPVAPPPKPAPGMAVQALAGEIVAALLADEQDGGYDLTAGMFGVAFSALVRRWAAAEFAQHAAQAAQPSINMVLHCPKCGLQHIDAPDHPYYGGMLTVDGFTPRWDNPPHRTHLCAGCGHKWRPADVPTNGVPAVQTKGKDDSPVVARVQPSLPAGPSGDTLADFRTGQWWHRELEMALKHGNPDQRRALAVLRNLLKTVEATVAAAQTP